MDVVRRALRYLALVTALLVLPGTVELLGGSLTERRAAAAATLAAGLMVLFRTRAWTPHLRRSHGYRNPADDPGLVALRKRCGMTPTDAVRAARAAEAGSTDVDASWLPYLRAIALVRLPSVPPAQQGNRRRALVVLAAAVVVAFAAAEVDGFGSLAVFYWMVGVNFGDLVGPQGARRERLEAVLAATAHLPELL